MSTPLLQPKKSVKRIRTDETANHCILCGDLCDEDRSQYPIELWTVLKSQAKEWQNLEKYGNVYSTVNWDEGPQGKFFHVMQA